MDSPTDRIRKRFANNPKALEVLKKIEEDIEAISNLDPAVAKAVEHLHREQAALMQRHLDGEITAEAYSDLLVELTRRTPREVHIASIKLSKTLIEAFQIPSDTADA